MVCCTTCRTPHELAAVDHVVVAVCQRPECHEKLRERQVPQASWKQIAAGAAVVGAIMGLIARFAG